MKTIVVLLALAGLAGCSELLPRDGDRPVELHRGWLTATRGDRCRSLVRGQMVRWECHL